MKFNNCKKNFRLMRSFPWITIAAKFVIENYLNCQGFCIYTVLTESFEFIPLQSGEIILRGLSLFPASIILKKGTKSVVYVSSSF